MPRLLMLLALAGCTFEPADTDVRTFTLRSDTTSESDEVDLSVPSHAYVFEDHAALDPVLRARVDLVCPDGSEMGFDDWYASQPAIIRRAFEGRTTSIASKPHTASDALRDANPACPCDIECWYCPDGAVICAFECAQLDC